MTQQACSFFRCAAVRARQPPMPLRESGGAAGSPGEAGKGGSPTRATPGRGEASFLPAPKRIPAAMAKGITCTHTEHRS